MSRYFVLLALAVFATTADAGAQSGKVAGFVPYKNSSGGEMIIFKLEGNVGSGCNVSQRFAIDASSQHFKGTQAAILAAFHAKTELRVVYNETCNVFGNAWDVSYVCAGAINC